MASLIPKWVKEEIVLGWTGESLWLMLLKDTHTPNASTQRYVSDVVANEITDNGGVYLPEGVQLPPGSLVALADGNNYALDGADLSIGPGATLNYRWGALYTKTGGSGQATYKLRAQIDFLTNQIVTNGTSTIQWNTLGIIYVS